MMWLLSWIPTWVWFIVAGVGLLFTAQLWLPLALAIWRVMPTWARVALGGLVALLGAFVAGRVKGTQTAREEQAKRDAGAVKKRFETNREIKVLTPEQKSKEIEKWYRD